MYISIAKYLKEEQVMRRIAFFSVCVMVLFGLMVNAADAQMRQDKTAGNVQSMTGVVIALDPDGNGLSVEGRLDGQAWVVAAIVTPETKILLKGKKAASLSDIKVGNRVNLTWTRTENDLYATSISVK
jgi:Cu/Ag efflux protein CusF